MPKIEPATITNQGPTNGSFGRRTSLSAIVILSLGAIFSGLLGVYFLGYSGWTYLRSVEAFGRFPQAFKDAIRQEATNQFIVGALLTLACLVFIQFAVIVSRNR